MMKGKNMTQNYYMFNGGKIVSDKPLLTEYPKNFIHNFSPVIIEYPSEISCLLETTEEQEIKKKRGYPIAKYFSPFIPLNQFCGTEDVTLNSFYIWTSYDKDKQIIENPSMKIDQAILQKLHIRD